MIEGQSIYQKSDIQQGEENLNSKFSANSEARIPSYVGVSCAVSGYRPLNKYDAVIREGFGSHSSPSRIALTRGHDSKGPLTSPDNTKEDQLNSLTTPSTGKKKLTTEMDSQAALNGHPASRFSRVVKVEHITTVDGTSTSHFVDKSLAHCDTSTDRATDGKSFVQQRIERLYGPAALGMAFQAKRAMLERYKEREKERGEENSSQAFIEHPHELPSVFRHLRPEFRYQLPVKTKISWSKITNFDKEEHVGDSLTNGHRVRHIPIEIEKDDEKISPSKGICQSPTEKSWKTLSRDLQALNGRNLKSSENLSSNLKSLDLDKSLDLNSAESKTMAVPREKNGHYFLQVVADEISFLEPKIAKIEEDLKTSGDEMTEEVKGKLLAASGKAKLLVSQKVEQFKGLCQKNITKSTTEEFPTTNEDLAGFWDMVSIQVEAVKELLCEIELLRKNNWKEQNKTTSVDPVKKPASRKVKSGAATSVSSSKSGKDPAKQKANEERRKQMREALNAKRKQAAKLKNANKESEVEIFIPEK